MVYILDFLNEIWFFFTKFNRRIRKLSNYEDDLTIMFHSKPVINCLNHMFWTVLDLFPKPRRTSPKTPAPWWDKRDTLLRGRKHEIVPDRRPFTTENSDFQEKINIFSTKCRLHILTHPFPQLVGLLHATIPGRGHVPNSSWEPKIENGKY